MELPERLRGDAGRATSPAKGVSGEPVKAAPPLPAPTLDTVRAAGLATILKGLADPHRLQILNMFAAAEEPGSARARDFERLGSPSAPSPITSRSWQMPGF
jgi:hypothetical protein